MTCREFVEFLVDYLSGMLPASVHAEFEEHLAECDDCNIYLKSYEETTKLGKTVFSASDDAIPADVPEKLVRAILSARSQSIR
jgi:anti-sigma factor RsiW